MTADPALIEALSTAEHRPNAALGEAVARPEAVADAVLTLLRLAAEGEILSPEQENLLFWGVHVLAHARDPRALPPLLALLRQDEETLDAVLGDAVTATLAKMLASLFDGDQEPFFRLILDSTVSDSVRQALLAACTFLCVEGRIERAAMHALLVRFDDAQAAVEGGIAWTAWEETVAHLAFRDLVPRVEAAQRDGRIDPSFSEPEWFRETLALAERRPDDRTQFDAWQYGYLDDPVAALDWTREGAGEPLRNPFKDVGRNDPCPCGSGKKFKKCCLGKEAAATPWTPPA